MGRLADYHGVLLRLRNAMDQSCDRYHVVDILNRLYDTDQNVHMQIFDECPNEVLHKQINTVCTQMTNYFHNQLGVEYAEEDVYTPWKLILPNGEIEQGADGLNFFQGSA